MKNYDVICINKNTNEEEIIPFYAANKKEAKAEVENTWKELKVIDVQRLVEVE